MSFPTLAAPRTQDDDRGMTNTHAASIAQFRTLHRPGDPFVLENVWDAWSARFVVAHGATAVATSSWAVAAAAGVEDGERLELGEVLALAARLVRSVNVPVSIDIEGGFGPSADDVGATIRRLANTGVVGCNLEDGLPDGGIRDRSDMTSRIVAARTAADSIINGWFLNARYDRFLQEPPETHATHLEEAIDRCLAYVEAGADGCFVPGLASPDLVAAIVNAVPAPINVMVVDRTSDLAAFTAAGVSRISRGPGLMLAVEESTGQLLDQQHARR